MYSQVPHSYPKKTQFPLGDLTAILVLGFFLFGSVELARNWTAAYQPSIQIDLSERALPLYAVYSLFRALIAYVASLGFTLIFGYWAAKSRRAERVILPLLDVGQSIPVLGFLPTLVLGLISVFPHSNFGLELACILMIFTGQVWNMTFSYYASLKSIPNHFHELSRNVRLTPIQRLFDIELPFASSGLAWNSLMSMAGGWFFLTICEAFTLGDRQYRLLGLGSYMATAIEVGNTRAILYGLSAMVAVILFMDFIVWRPVIAWTRRFRLDEQNEQVQNIPFIQMLLKESRLVRVLEKYIHSAIAQIETLSTHLFKPRKRRRTGLLLRRFRHRWISLFRYTPSLNHLSWVPVLGLGLWILMKLAILIHALKAPEIILILQSAGYTFLRVLGALVLSTLWTVPFGIWVGLSPKRTRFFQPIIQVAASFPAPMLYPIVLFGLSALGVGLGVGASILMLLGVQWYILFNVLAGATLISRELRETFYLFRSPLKQRLFDLYLPSIFPSLVTGWITASGGAWNASIVAEYIQYHGQTLRTVGLGALISQSTSDGNFPLLAGALIAMVSMVLVLNRTIWRRAQVLCERKFRFER